MASTHFGARLTSRSAGGVRAQTRSGTVSQQVESVCALFHLLALGRRTSWTRGKVRSESESGRVHVGPSWNIVYQPLDRSLLCLSWYRDQLRTPVMSVMQSRRLSCRRLSVVFFFRELSNGSPHSTWLRSRLRTLWDCRSQKLTTPKLKPPQLSKWSPVASAHSRTLVPGQSARTIRSGQVHLCPVTRCH